ncbi:MAG: hypothetical protein WAJ85_04625 [Candidatus Baltobacteraceae bacterium]
MIASPEQWTIALYAGVGLGALLIGLGVFVLCVRAGGLLGRVGRTLDEVDKQIGALSAPIATTLSHVEGIADTADTTIARLGSVVNQLENVAAGATKTANLINATLNSVNNAVRTKPKTTGPT